MRITSPNNLLKLPLYQIHHGDCNIGIIFYILPLLSSQPQKMYDLNLILWHGPPNHNLNLFKINKDTFIRHYMSNVFNMLTKNQCVLILAYNLCILKIWNTFSRCSLCPSSFKKNTNMLCMKTKVKTPMYSLSILFM